MAGAAFGIGREFGGFSDVRKVLVEKPSNLFGDAITSSFEDRPNHFFWASDTIVPFD